MKDTNQKIRIKDIAKLAGVSEGTVDRVLHQRGDVSAKSKASVNKILEEINYSPNLFARTLASKKQYHFVCLFPEHQPTDYWHRVDAGFDLAAREFSNYNVIITKKYFDQFDANSFEKISAQVLENTPDAVFITPIFGEETKKLTHELNARNIPFSFFDSLLDETDFVTYYGQHSFDSGYIAAKLLFASLPEQTKVLIIRTQRKGSGSNQTLNRYSGFMQFINDNNLIDKVELISIELKDNEERLNSTTLTETFNAHASIKAAITFNSKVCRLAKHLETMQKMDVQLIGYDLLDENVAYLKKGMISYLIVQRPEKQAYFTVRDMCRKLIFKQPVNKINYVPIDILMKENIDYYLNFKE